MTSDIDALRQAARERNPEQTQFVLKRLFLNMSFYRALAVSVERAHAFLETFERYYPGADWARQVIVQITSLATAPQLPAEALRDYTAPGAANFFKALSDLAHSVQQNEQKEARIGYLVSAVVNAITAELVETYYGDRLDDWECVRTSRIDPATGQYEDPEVTRIAYDFWTDETVAARDITAWLAVADAVAANMERD